MPLNVEAIRAHRFETFEQSVSDKDAMLFALSVGVAADPMDSDELRYVFEQNLQTFPTLPIVLGYPGPWMLDPRFGINRQMIVHGTQRLEVHAPLRIGVPFVASNRVLALVDKGPDGGAIIVVERSLRDKLTGERQLPRDFRVAPDRAPDDIIDMPTQPNQALWYRLNGDRNPLHASPAFAARAGFARPILHGLCTYSVAAHGLMKLNPGRALNMIETRFSKPVYPGETLRLEAWNEAGG